MCPLVGAVYRRADELGAILENDLGALGSLGERELMQLLAATHSGMTTAGAGARFVLLVHRTDAQREWAYDRESHVGALSAAWDEAVAEGWALVSVKDDWNTVFPN